MSVPIAAMHSVVKAAGTTSHGMGSNTANNEHANIVLTLTQDELQKINEVFKTYETGVNEGMIYPKDLSMAMKQLGLNPTESEIQDLINEIEVNGFISYHSFCIEVVRKLRDDDEENFHQELFRTFVGPKHYGSGMAAKRNNISKELLSAETFKEIMMNLPEKVSEQEAEEMFAEADKDRNGRISYGEFRKMCVISRTEVVPDQAPKFCEEEVTDFENFL